MSLDRRTREPQRPNVSAALALSLLACAGAAAGVPTIGHATQERFGDLAPSFELCVTDDGVVLHETVDGRNDTTLEKVTYGQLPDALFKVPDGYKMKRLPPSSD